MKNLLPWSIKLISFSENCVRKENEVVAMSTFHIFPYSWSARPTFPFLCLNQMFLVKHKSSVAINWNLFNIKNCLSDVHPLLCLKSNTKFIISDLPFPEWHLTRKIRYLTGKQVHSDHESDCTVFYTDVKCFSHPKHLILNTSIFNRAHFSCHIFVHDPCWSWGIEGVEWGVNKKFVNSECLK